MHYTQYLLSGDITLYSKLSEAIPCGECAVNFLLLYICLSSHLLARLLAPKAPRCNSRIYRRFLPQLEKTHETFPSLRDEARFPCIVSRAIAFSHEMGVSGNLWIVVKDVKTLVVYDVE